MHWKLAPLIEGFRELLGAKPFAGFSFSQWIKNWNWTANEYVGLLCISFYVCKIEKIDSELFSASLWYKNIV